MNLPTQDLTKIWLTSDTHIGHANILKHDKRPFNFIEEHDAALIANWNYKVGPEDVVFHLGDVARNVAVATGVIPRLHGQIILVRGNHDDDLWRKARALFHSSHEAGYFRIAGEQIYLSHYAHRVWRNSHRGSFHFHGHSHGALPPRGRSMDVGTMLHGYAPLNLDSALRRLEGESFINHH